MALGADARQLQLMVLKHGLFLAFTGVFLGTVAAGVAARFASSLLFGVSPADPTVFIGVPVLLLGVAALASYVPAVRATRLSPTTALRCE
jgi:putative ABC transport system permease protein